MSGAASIGGAPVGRIDTLQPLEGLSVRALRRWCDGGHEALAEDLGCALGEDHGDRAARAFDALCRQCLSGCRRPLMRHGGGCLCLGADEAAFAQLVRTATEGDREDALMLACCMVRHDLAPILVHLAQAAGLALRSALVSWQRPSALH
ncbi:hypothetical protein FHG66_02630 [Rubellimicrobium rubrum]|uniref:Uncharacterized protein n=1 Tax=Rubellimicrobium rubrum TaxID=2585369 RepID=A0A5C4N5X4_9RHOB|nr:hypothetical protein [Rubellimicrobium rubrum]TNC52452.1 hypothetical protein FHG66_02630 [Rubellimicrobium rubrum]